MKKDGSAFKKFSKALDIPRDILLSIPKILLTGNEEIYIENYRGIINYSEEEIKINTTKMPIKISGAKMSITEIAPDEITVTGKIKSVEFVL